MVFETERLILRPWEDVERRFLSFSCDELFSTV